MSDQPGYDDLVQQVASLSEQISKPLSLDDLPLADLRKRLIENGDPLDLSVMSLAQSVGTDLLVDGGVTAAKLAVPVWHVVGAASEPALQNGWVALGGTEPPPRFCKDTAGIVYVQAAIKNGTADTAIFTLPVGYRPAYDLKFAGRNGATGGVIGVSVSAAGVVNTLNTAANANLSLTASFRADQ